MGSREGRSSKRKRQQASERPAFETGAPEESDEQGEPAAQDESAGASAPASTAEEWPEPAGALFSHPADLVAAMVLAATACAYLLLLNRHGFWYDEIRTAESIRLSLFEMVAERARNGHAPLFFSML